MHFVKLGHDVHVNLDAILLVEITDDEGLKVVGLNGTASIRFLSGDPGGAILRSAIESHSNASFYDAVQMYVLKKPTPPEVRDSSKPKSQV